MPYLFPVKLQGAGTSEVEALGSYIIRLGIAHSVSFATLMERVRLGYFKEHPNTDQKLFSGALNNRPCVFARPNLTTLYFEKILAHATGETNLRCGTFLALFEAIKRSRRTFAETMRWCPICMLEFLNDGDSGYFKLLWHLQDVTHCPLHEVRLRDRCYRCKSLQNSLARRDNCTTCVHCGAPLGRWATSQDSKNRWKNQGADLIELVEAIGKNPQLSFPASAIRSILQHPSIEVSTKDEDLYVACQTQVTFTRARRVAYRLGIGLSDLLAGSIDTLTRPLEPSWTEVLPDDMQPRPRGVFRDRKKILRRLNRMVSARAPKQLPSLETFARRLGVSVGYLHYQFPHLARAHIERHKAWREERQRCRRLMARTAALTFFTQEQDLVGSRSRKAAFAKIRGETGLPKNLLREEIEVVWQALAPSMGMKEVLEALLRNMFQDEESTDS